MGNCFLYKRGFGGASGGAGGGGSTPEVEKTASGKVISIHGSMEKPLKGLRLFGKTTQNGTPSPDAPVPLESVGDGGSIVVSVAGGKNLLNYEAWKTVAITRGTAVWENNGVTLTATGDDCFTNYGSADPGSIVPVTVGETITLSWEEESNAMGSIYIFPNGQISGNVKASNATNKKLSYTVPDGVTFIKFRFGVTSSGVTVSYKNIQIEVGSAATAYEPYKEPRPTTLPTPNGLPGVHVSDGGNYTDENGWQWICDEMDFGRGKYVQNVYYHTFDGTESDISYVAGTNWYIAKPLATLAYGRGAIISSHYPANARTNVENTGYLNSSGLVVFNDKSFTGIDALKAYFAANPVTVCYPLATPIETDLTPEQLSAYAALHTLSPNTTIYNDADSYMEVKYMAKGG